MRSMGYPGAMMFMTVAFIAIASAQEPAATGAPAFVAPSAADSVPHVTRVTAFTALTGRTRAPPFATDRPKPAVIEVIVCWARGRPE